ncbi:MAG: antibiotic biosynthesis monooxygenase [Niastella sp.]|nr:antibiotic biosynthesis monooxygenase [Niastella sp.]
MLITTSLLLGSTGAMTQNGTTTPNTEEVAVLTRYEVKEGQQKTFRSVLGKYIKQANAQTDNIMAEGYHEQENPSILWIIERWSSKAAFDKNRKLLSGNKLVQPAKTIYVKDLEPLTKAAWQRKPGKDDKPITIILFVDSKPGTETTFKTVYHTAMPQFRSEPGVINYQLSQLEEDNTQFVTYEKFRNDEAFQYHLKFPPIQPVIDYLNTSIKKQPFQTGLHRLIEFAPVKRK